MGFVRKRVWIAAAAALLLALVAAVAGRAYGADGSTAAVPAATATNFSTLAGVATGLPPSWIPVSRGGGGGVVWSGLIPNRYVANERPSAIYLPPAFSSTRRYPVLYLLHGLHGSPSSYYDSLHLAQIVDQMIAAGQLVPMIIVIPAGANSNSAEWAGRWGSFVANEVVPWVNSHLPTLPGARNRALEGLCAGGYGAVDIGLRHPGLFGTLGSWEGYFAPVFRDGPFAHASQSVMNANNPTLLVRSNAASLRRAGVRFYVSVGGNHGRVLRRWTISFAKELSTLRLPHQLWLLPQSERGHFWTATLPSALQYAAAGFA